jgi:DNA-binding IclR family transcriptional regulator
MKNNNQYILQSVDNALQLIELLVKEEDMSLVEISKKLKINKSTVFRILTTLENRKFVSKTKDAKYNLGIKFAHFGSVVIERLDLTKVARPYLSKLRDRFNETTHMAIMDDDFNIIFIAKEKSNSTIQMSSNVGVKLPAYCTATGKAMLAFLPEEVLKDYINKVELIKYTCNTIVDPSRLVKELERIRRIGFSEDLEESEIGLICYAAPVRNIKGNVIAAVSISGPSARMENNRNELVKAIQETSKEISCAFGWSGDM